jgi:hypothetical protein
MSLKHRLPRIRLALKAKQTVKDKLNGTVLNEGARKGILVTTSDYGSDSYNFAKGKPITL